MRSHKISNTKTIHGLSWKNICGKVGVGNNKKGTYEMSADRNDSTRGFFILIAIAIAIVFAGVVIPEVLAKHTERAVQAKIKKEDKLNRHSVPVPATTVVPLPKF